MPTPTQTSTEPPLRPQLRAFHEDDPRRSWRELSLSFGALLALWPLLFLPLPLPVRLALAPAVAALMLRLCSLGHDWTHGAILRGSAAARWVVHLIGLVVLAPPRIWADTHHHHHAHNAVLGEPAVGSFPVWTLAEYRAASPASRLGYRLARSPLLMLLAWPIVFVLGLNTLPFLQRPRRYWTSGLAVLLHGALNALALSRGLATWGVAVALPYTLLASVGAYLFYAQHSFPGAVWRARSYWDYEHAALRASSYLGLPRWMAWVAGNIHYHHIHHLDPLVPFYRLPEAFAALPALQRPPDSRLRPGDLAACLGLALWEEREQRWIRWGDPEIG